MKHAMTIAACAALFIAAAGCQEHASAPAASASKEASCPDCDAAVDASPKTAAATAPASAPAHVDVPTTGVRTITLPAIESPLPDGPGKINLVATCTLCHSPRYVTTQPRFTKKKWTEEVEKMKKVYGAPIQDAQIEPIVDYLVAVRGK